MESGFLQPHWHNLMYYVCNKLIQRRSHTAVRSYSTPGPQIARGEQQISQRSAWCLSET